MKLLRTQQRINELFARFVAEVKGATAIRRTDINHVSETLLIPILAEVYGYKNLRNLNSVEHEDFPAIDLGDKDARVAIQVTSTTTSEKIKSTLQKFVEHELYKEYDRLIIYILTDKQNTYSGKG